MKSRTQKIINGIIAAPFLLLGSALVFVLLNFFYCEANKAYWDHKVDRMCEKYGGVTIYERVSISKQDYPNAKFTSTEDYIVPFESDAGGDDLFFFRYDTEYLRKGAIDVMKHTQSIVRISDKKILSAVIAYGRRGGDPLLSSWMHPSHHSCPGVDKWIKEFSSTITVMER